MEPQRRPYRQGECLSCWLKRAYGKPYPKVHTHFLWRPAVGPTVEHKV